MTRIAWIHVALVAAILLPLLAVRPANAAMGRVVAAESLNIRACAALDCQVIGAAHLGDAIEITGGIVSGFYPVRWFGQDGHAFALGGVDDARLGALVDLLLANDIAVMTHGPGGHRSIPNIKQLKSMGVRL
jgi:hypothetical protein